MERATSWRWLAGIGGVIVLLIAASGRLPI